MEVDGNLADEFKELSKENVEFSKKCAKIVQEINSGQLTIVQLVEQLGPLLVDVSPNNRELGTWILTQVLEGLAPNHFDSKQLNFICVFYADRLKDHHQVVPAILPGIIALAKFEAFPEGAATKILAALFHNVSCQQQQQQDRRNIYKIFDILLDKCATELCTMGLDYVYGVITAVDGERDPRNLIFLFKWFPKFLKIINLGHLAEETFEILACYFPVDFRAPPQDPDAITRNALAEALAPCLTAIPQFAEFCFPLALEKLDASLEIAKTDALNLLEIGCGTFDTSSYVQHSTEIWSQIQKQLFNNPKPEVKEACLKALSAVIEKISQDPALNGTVKDISDTVKRNLLPDSKLYEPSWQLLLTVARASRDSCALITRDIAPILINTFNISSTVSHKVAVLKTSVEFFDSYLTLHDTIDFEDLHQIPILCLKGAVEGNDELRRVGFDGLTQIARYLPFEVRSRTYDNLRKLLLMPQPESVRFALLNCFDELAKNFPIEVKEKVIDLVEITDIQSLELFLDAICIIAYQDSFTNQTLDTLLDYLIKEIRLAQIAVNSLRNLIEKYENNEKIHSVLHEKNIITKLVDWSVQQDAHLAEKSLKNLSFILKSIIGKQSSQEQRDIVQKQLPKIGDVSKQSHLPLLDGILCRLRQDVEIDYIILVNLTEVAWKTNSSFQRNVAVQLVANLINKCSNDDALLNYLNQTYQNMTDVTLSAWITKALVMRNHERANIWTDKLIQMLEVNANVAVAFKIIVDDNYDTLSRKSHCNKMLLYRQKFFVVVSNRFMENFRPELKSYLVAFGYLLEHTPRQAILLQFKKVLKLIILCLDECEDSEVLLVLLQVISDFVVKKEKCIEDHLQEFLTRLLKLANFDKSMKVRILALRCLQDYTSSFPVYKLLPHKTEVLKVLGKVIDDKKRIVRREAVEARSIWFLLDAPV